ncbi:MAG TPA: GDP-fucose synthetase [Opitutae bacterium]|nr:GDP-fucose synthetase [Opitutae bacterium]
MVGSAVVRCLERYGHDAIITRSRDELDLCNPQAVDRFFAEARPSIVVLAAARVGGIVANNTYPVEFSLENLAIAQNVIRAAFESGVKRLLFLGSSCIYPREAPQPIREEYLLTGPLEETNEAYALAKIMGLKLCQYYRKEYGALFHSAMPTNLYGPGDYYHPENSHVIPGLLRRFHDAKESGAEEVVLWGTGSPKREFLHVDDLAEGLVHLLSVDHPPDWVNIGYGEDIAIRDLAEMIREVTGFSGRLAYDSNRPDGTPRKLLDVSKIKSLGWSPKISLKEGLTAAYQDFLQSRLAGALRE